MTSKKKWLGILTGSVLVLALILGVTAAFAQSSDEAETAEETPPLESGDRAVQESDEENPAPPAFGRGRGQRGFAPEMKEGFRSQEFRGQGLVGPRGPNGNEIKGELLAKALDVSVEELEEAHDAAREAAREILEAAIEDAAADGLIDEDLAQQLLEGERPSLDRETAKILLELRGSIDIDHEALLADALDIAVEKLQTARDEAFVAGVALMVEEGRITQEQADIILGRKAVGEYIDNEAIQAYILEAYEAAVQEAFANGSITEEQRDQLLEEGPVRLGGQSGFNGRSQGRGLGGFSNRGCFNGHPSFHGRPGFHGAEGGPGGFRGSAFPGTDSTDSATSGV